MPDEHMDALAEQEPGGDFDAAFDADDPEDNTGQEVAEDGGGDAGEGDAAAEAEAAKPAGKKEARTGEPTGGPDGKSAEGGEAQPPTADERLAELERKRLAEDAGQAKDQGGESGQAAKDERATAAPTGMTKEEFHAYLQFGDDVGLPKDAFYIGDKQIDPGAFQEDFPEHMDMIKVMSLKMTQKFLNHCIERGELLPASEVKKSVEGLKNEIKELKFWTEVRSKHQDVDAVNADKQFWAWLAKQSRPIQDMATRARNAEELITVLDAYDAHVGRSKLAEHDRTAQERKQSKDDLYRHTLRSSVPKVQQAGSPQDEFDQAWEQGDD